MKIRICDDRVGWRRIETGPCQGSTSINSTINQVHGRSDFLWMTLRQGPIASVDAPIAGREASVSVDDGAADGVENRDEMIRVPFTITTCGSSRARSSIVSGELTEPTRKSVGRAVSFKLHSDKI